MANNYNIADQPSKAGTAIARASSTGSQVTVTDVTDVDIPGMSISIVVPADRDVWVVAKVPYCGHSLANGTVTVKLTDETTENPTPSGSLKDYATMRTSTVDRNHVTLILDEVIPAGSGMVIRKLRSRGGTVGGYINGLGLGRITLDAFVR